MQKTINGATFRKMVLAGVGLLEQNKEYIDSLNVFPVPDGDTGTNMFLTMKSAITEINKCMNNDMSSLSEAFSNAVRKFPFSFSDVSIFSRRETTAKYRRADSVAARRSCSDSQL